MRIKITKRLSKKIKDFSREEYKSADMEHYGFETDWKGKKFILTAEEGDKLVGVIQVEITVGVAEVRNMLVAASHRGQGVGSALMKEMEKIAKKEGAHKIFLETGKDWVAEKFYQKLGYQKTGDLPKHYVKRDFVEYTKFL